MRKCINSTINKFIRFFIKRKNAPRLAAKIERKAIEDYYEVINELNKKERKTLSRTL